MSLQTKLDTLSSKITTKLGKAGKKTVDQLSDYVDQLVYPQGTVNIAENGIATVSGYQNANVSVTTYQDDYDNCVSRTGTIFNSPASSLNTDALYNWNITEFHMPNLLAFSGIGSYNKSLKVLDLPSCTTITSGCCSNYTAVETINLPNCTTISGSNRYTFGYCNKLTSISLPKLTNIPMYTFYSSSALTTIDLGAAVSIYSYGFYNATSLNTLYIRTNKVCTLNYTNAFSSTGITSTTGYIYVPSNLVDSYKSAANWSTFKNRIFAIPE